MSKKYDLASVDELSIEPLTDEELDGVAGGWNEFSTADSCVCCAAGATNQEPEDPIITT